MPVLSIETNVDIDKLDTDSILQSTSQFVASILNKPERYVMVRLQKNNNLIFADTSEPLAYVELKSINLPEDRTAELSSGICQHISECFSINQDRIYIEFANAQRNMFGWNGGTF